MQRGVEVDHCIAHLDPAQLAPGDTVIGTLPVHLAAEVCARKGRYLHLSLTVPADKRGSELSLEDMQACQARLEAFWVASVPDQ